MSTAMSNGVLSNLLSACTSAPCLMSVSATPWWPCCAAQWRAVIFSMSLALMSAPLWKLKTGLICSVENKVLTQTASYSKETWQVKYCEGQMSNSFFFLSFWRPRWSVILLTVSQHITGSGASEQDGPPCLVLTPPLTMLWACDVESVFTFDPMKSDTTVLLTLFGSQRSHKSWESWRTRLPPKST